MTKKNLISPKEVKHIAKLAHLKVKKEELGKFGSQLSSVLGYTEKIGEMKTNKIKGTSQVTGLTNGFRSDKVDRSRMLTQDQALANAKKTHKGYFVVKAIFK